MKPFVFILSLFVFCTYFYAQDTPLCGADELRIGTLQEHPQIAKAVEQREAFLENFTQDYLQNKSITGVNSYIIPVVFHVIHNNGVENISEAQIRDAVKVLNDRLNKRSADTNSIVDVFKPLHANCGIEFRLAKIDPDGFCTNGINRIVSTLTNSGGHAVKDLIQWPTHQYLNVYVVKNAAGLAGHAVWPSDADTIPAWDGIVIGHNYTGSIGTANALRSVVLTHEVGHYLNLHHIWGGNNVPGFYYLPCAQVSNCGFTDYVEDTPPTIGWQSCNLNGNTCDSLLDNVQNAMDYSYCNKMFTHGQKDRMRACLNSPIAGRNNLWTPANLAATGVLDTSTAPCPPMSVLETNTNKRYRIFPNPVQNILNIATDGEEQVIEIHFFNAMGHVFKVEKIAPSQYSVAHLPNGIYFLTLKGQNGEWETRKIVLSR